MKSGNTLTVTLVFLSLVSSTAIAQPQMLEWTELPAIPNELGLAGPFVGTHNEALIVAGGANFPTPLWDTEKVWHDEVFVLTQEGDTAAWQSAGTLPKAAAYGACVSIAEGVLCIGGNDAADTFADVFLLSWNTETETISTRTYPSLPKPTAFGAAAVVNDIVYLAGGQQNSDLSSATSELWVLDLSRSEEADFGWQRMSDCPGPNRAFNLTVAQNNGYDDCVYVMTGRRQDGDAVEFLKDNWEYNTSTGKWRQRADLPSCMMAGTGIGIGQSHVMVLGGADGSLFTKSNELRDLHPGFPRQSFAFHTITNTWTSAGTIPANHVTTTAVKWQGDIVVPTGEVRPRVRSPEVWKLTPGVKASGFGVVNYVVLVAYLLSMVAVGAYFSKRNNSTDQYFRGGKGIPWWAAGCSIFATMLSSLTFMAVPSKAFAQDWVYAVGNFTIPVVAILAVKIALPFFRRIDATSAYEYLELRFDRRVRLFGSASFTVFHVFRMAVVMSLTGLALAVATPLSPQACVILMGVLSIAYCTMGGIEAVIWTDTIQTVVLLGGAVLAILFLVNGVDGGLDGFMATAQESSKFNIANLHLDATARQIALWVIVVGGLAQNVSSYTADQAVVQRYMTTPDARLAARSIWTNAFLSIPATLIFYTIGTALFAFYQSHPDRLDPTATTDQVFPMFIAQEMPIGIAGLLVAAIFAAAQSTVSTSMNSTATTIVTDFMKPFAVCDSDAGYLKAARWLTLSLGILGTALALVFVDPNIRSLFDQFLKIIGLFMGVLGGLFVLGVFSTKANSIGALSGAFVGAAVMFFTWKYTPVSGYLYSAIGIATCVVFGYVVSMITPQPVRNIDGLTVFTLDRSATTASAGK